MRLTSATIRNFRGIEELELDFDPRLNLLIGDNGSGKTAILEALTIAVGSLFIGFRDVPSRGIINDEVRFTKQQEFAYPVTIQAFAEVDECQQIRWKREKNSQRGSTTHRNAADLKHFGKELDRQVRSGESVNLPLISYFSTVRLSVQAKERKKKKSSGPVKELGSRFRGYKESLDVRSNFPRFLRWFRDKELSQLQKKQPDLLFEQVRKAICTSLPVARQVYYDFDPDTSRGLTVELKDGRVLPFDYLSDGMRNYVAIVADIAHRCALLNPHLGENALTQTEGIVLIDELDLHLHPAWQKSVLNSLLTTFPNVQFILTTHSPFLIQETEEGQLIQLKNCRVESISGGNQLSIEDIAEYKQGVANPQWSGKREAVYTASKNMLSKLAAGEPVTTEEEEAFAEKMKPYSVHPGFEALLEMKKLKG